MNPPPNPHDAEARAAMMQHNAPLLQNPPRYDYYLTWPAHQSGVVTIAGQWKRNVDGDVEAWYSAEQLRAALREMELIKNFKLSS